MKHGENLFYRHSTFLHHHCHPALDAGSIRNETTLWIPHQVRDDNIYVYIKKRRRLKVAAVFCARKRTFTKN
jgi:hypothetical protein